MRTVAQETAFQIALRNCSEEVGEGSALYMILAKGVHVVKRTFWQRPAARLVKVTASLQEQTAPLMILVLF